MTFRGFLLVAAIIVAILAALALNFNPASLVGSQQKKNDALIRSQMAHHIGNKKVLQGRKISEVRT